MGQPLFHKNIERVDKLRTILSISYHMAQSGLKPGANQQVSAGELIIAQGQSPRQIVILHKGTVSIRACGPDQATPSITTSRFLSSISAPAILGANALLLQKNVPYYAITEDASVVSVYPASPESLVKIMAGKPKIGILMLRTMVKQVLETQNKVSETEAMIKNLADVLISLGLGYYRLFPDRYSDEGAAVDPILQHAFTALKHFQEKKLQVPEELEIPFLKAGHSDVLGTGYKPHRTDSESDFSYLKRVIALEPALLGAIAQRDPEFLIITGKKIAMHFTRHATEIHHAFDKVKEYCDQLFNGPYSWMEKISNAAEIALKNESTESNLTNLCHYFTDEIKNIENEYRTLFALTDYSADVPAFHKIQQYITLSKKAAVAATDLLDTDSEAITGGTGGVEELKGSLENLLHYASISPETGREIKEAIEKLKEFNNPMNSEGDPRKIRRGLLPKYWELYEKVFMSTLQEPGKTPRFAELMLLCGFTDDTFLEPEQLEFIYKNVKREKSKYPIHDAIDWMSMIVERKVTTSINELGLTFFDILRQENRNENWRRESDLPADVDTPEARLLFEIHNTLAPTTKLTSGSILTHLPVLSKFHFNQSPERAWMGKKKLEEELDRLLSIDFGAFHREVLYSNEEIGIKREFVQMQVLPNIIMAPSIGNTMQFWQEREGNNKTSPGRIMTPLFATDNVFDMLLHVAGSYRWEMVKTTLGPDWNNISSSSITADYTDYVQFFKKNRELSPEVKEKLAAEFKRFRDDRSRFVNDYMTWIKYESDGTQRLNKACRKIMAKHIPFTTPLRENLLKLPNFTEIITKATNIKKRKALELEPRYKKYRNENAGVLPKELEDTLKFYNLEF